jgi:hypothetical protein
MASATPGLCETLSRDWMRAARFYARFDISESQFRHGVQEPEAAPTTVGVPHGKGLVSPLPDSGCTV